MADAPAMCYSFAVRELKGCTPAEATGFLTAAYHELREKPLFQNQFKIQMQSILNQRQLTAEEDRAIH